MTVNGSSYKCQPYFYGKDVESSSQLQKANDLYDTNIMMSDDAFKYFPTCVKKNCRKVDTVYLNNQTIDNKKLIKNDINRKMYSIYCMNIRPEVQKVQWKLQKLPKEVKLKQRIVIKE